MYDVVGSSFAANAAIDASAEFVSGASMGAITRDPRAMLMLGAGNAVMSSPDIVIAAWISSTEEGDPIINPDYLAFQDERRLAVALATNAVVQLDSIASNGGSAEIIEDMADQITSAANNLLSKSPL